MSLPIKKLPGTSYSVQLQANLDKSGKLCLVKGKWPVIEKICPSLDARTVNSILEDIILSEGFELNPRILSRIVGELLEEMSEVSTTPVVVEKSSDLIEIEEHTPPIAVQPLLEEVITPPASELITSPSITTTTSTPSIENSSLSEETFEHIQVLKTQIKELHTLIKDMYKKIDALTIIAEKLEN